MRTFATPFVVCGALATLLSACSGDSREMQPPSPDQTQSIAVTTTIAGEIASVEGFSITTPWADGGSIDAKYTCAGAGMSLPVTFSGIEPDIITLAISLVDETAGLAVHWIVANIDVTQPALAEGALPAGAIQSINVSGSTGYLPVCALAGQTHTFRLTGYGLPQQVELPDGSTSDALMNAIEIAALDTVSNTFTVKG